MRTVHELTANELLELRANYFRQLQDTDPDALGFITEENDIPLEAILHHYDSVSFVKEDFFCNN